MTRASLLIAALLVGCGGKVVVDSGSTSTSTVTTTTVGLTCDSLPAGAQFTCLNGLPGGTCPTQDAPAAHQQLATDMGLCDGIANPSGCCGATLTEVACGPTANQIAEGCCYYYLVEELACLD